MGETAAGKDLFVNPYVAQMDRFAGSLKHLSDVFLGLEKKRRTFTGEEIGGMAAGVSEKVCAGCERRDACGEEDPQKAARMVYEIIAAAEEYGLTVILPDAENITPNGTDFYMIRKNEKRLGIYQ